MLQEKVRKEEVLLMIVGTDTRQVRLFLMASDETFYVFYLKTVSSK